MKKSPSAHLRSALLAGGFLALALALSSGLRVSALAGSLGWYDDTGGSLCDDVDAANPGASNPTGGANPCWHGAREDQQEGYGGLPACADDVDNDSDELTDCADPDCFGQDGCGSGEWCNVESAEFAGQDGSCGADDGGNKCRDGVDNDSDGLTDCEDPDCAYTLGTWDPVCELVGDPTCAEYTCNAGGIGQDEAQCGGDCSAERCADGQDNDGDGQYDCGDEDCAYRAACQAQPEWDEQTCSDAIDNDQDGAIDCDDVDCSGASTCWWAYSGWNPGNWWESYETDCGDGIDNDNDGMYDCADASDCAADYRCSSTGGDLTETSPWGYYDEYYCQNGGDDDGDGFADCADSDCAGTSACSSCHAERATETDADADCQPDTLYWGSACNDGNDNDGDGLTDCADDDCTADAVCLVGQAVWEPNGKDWLVGLSCNGTDYGGGCLPEETGYHYRGNFDGQECWWYTKNQAWQTDRSTNLYNLAKTFGLDPSTGRTTWCHAFGDTPNLQSDDSGSYNDPNQIGAFGWCGGAPQESGGFTCFSPESQDPGVVWWDPTTWSGSSCGDGVCADGESCATDCSIESFCADGVDNDQDGAVDGGDADCVTGDPVCDNESSWNAGEIGECAPGSDAGHCSDGLDNDNDGLYDCGDEDCAADAACSGTVTGCDDTSACNYGMPEICEYASCGAGGGATCADTSACNYGESGACEYDSCNTGGSDDVCGDGKRTGDEECDGPVDNGSCEECQVKCDAGYSNRKTIWPFDGNKHVCSQFSVNNGICGESYQSCPNPEYPFDYSYRPPAGADTWKCGSQICGS